VPAAPLLFLILFIAERTLAFASQAQEVLLVDFHSGAECSDVLEFCLGDPAGLGLQKKITKHIQGKAELPVFEKLIEQSATRFTPTSAWENRTQRF
jgi:hypothetical protein